MPGDGPVPLRSAPLRPVSLLETLPDRQHWPDASRWWIGLSGGLDSTVLLHLLVSLREKYPLPPLVALHVDHQLSSQSLEWAAHCSRVCEQLDVELIIRQVQVTDDGSGPESAARAARYAVFEELLAADELLLLAHHHDDQVETFFLRLLRGAGTLGLGGMPRQRRLGRAQLLRPLLTWRRLDLEAYARGQNLDWVEDDSNRDQSLDRNYLRHAVLPLLEQRWPGYRRSVEQAMFAVSAAETELAQSLRPQMTAARSEYSGEPVLNLASFAELGEETCCRLLRLWIAELGEQPPGRQPLQELVRQLQTADPAASPRLEAGNYCLQRYRGRLHMVRLRLAPTILPSCELRPDQPLDIPGLGWVAVRHSDESGMRLPVQGFWRLGFRSGGERCRPAGRDHSQSLKKLLQEYGVPPWQRQFVPLLYDGEELAAVGDLWICEGHQANPGVTAYRIECGSNFAATVD
jgi:tRNA(Ile)-lysidine synthase